MRRLGLLLLLAIAAAGGFSAWLDPRINKPYKGYHQSEIFVDIPKGASRWTISGMLAKDRVIRSRIAFEMLSRLHGHVPLQAGSYRFDQQMNARQVFWKIAKGQVFVYNVSIPEGWTMYDIADALQREGLCNREDFLRAAHDTSLISDIAPHAQSLEGFLYPSTYEFTRHTSPEQIAATMVRQFRVALRDATDSGSVPNPHGLDTEQIVTIASLVERETPQPQERPLVASVFYNRLGRKYPLQCDPTVQYALATQGKIVRNVSHSDLSVDSPYNTYRHTGLPPGPIANPGEASLEAALHPAETSYMYFVANDQRGHFFSSTLAQHNRNVARYRHLIEIGADPSDPAGISAKRHGGGS